MSPADCDVIGRSLGEPAVFGEIFERHSDAVHAYLSRRGGRGAADELTGEVFRVAFESRRRFDRSRTSARPWLYGIATNTLRRHRRDGWRQQSAYRKLTRSLAAVPDESDATVAAVDAARQRTRLSAAVRSLSPRDREALLLHVWEDLTYAEIAEMLKIPIGTVRSRIHRARQGLQKALGTDPAACSLQSSVS